MVDTFADQAEHRARPFLHHGAATLQPRPVPRRFPPSLRTHQHEIGKRVNVTQRQKRHGRIHWPGRWNRQHQRVVQGDHAPISLRLNHFQLRVICYISRKPSRNTISTGGKRARGTPTYGVSSRCQWHWSAPAGKRTGSWMYPSVTTFAAACRISSLVGSPPSSAIKRSKPQSDSGSPIR